MRTRTLRRPLGGWGARQWRSDVRGWLWLAFLTVMSWGALNAIEGVIALFAQ